MPYMSKARRESLEYQFFALSGKKIDLSKDFDKDGWTKDTPKRKKKDTSKKDRR